MEKAADLASRIYKLFQSGDNDAVAGLFGNALLAIPGQTTLSGDHKDKAAIVSVLAQVTAARASGRHCQEPVCSYASDTAAMFVFDNFVRIGGKTEQYHSVHEWIMRDGKLVAMMVYVHEYDVFARAWGKADPVRSS